MAISADPEDAELYIDGKFHGNAPATRKLPAGAHAILLKSAGLSDSTRTVEVPAAGTLTLKGTLQKSDGAP